MKVDIGHLYSIEYFKPQQLSLKFAIIDQHHLIVSPGDEGIVTVVAHQSKQEVIPCKPTSPDVELTLLDPNGNEVINVQGCNTSIP